MSERDNTSCSLWRDSESDIGLMTRLTSNQFFFVLTFGSVRKVSFGFLR